MHLLTILLLVLLYLIVLATFSLLILFAIFPLKAAFSFSSELQQDFYLIMTWLGSTFKAVLCRNQDKSLITIYLFNKKVFAKDLKRQTKQHRDIISYIKTIRPEHITLQSSYGFEDPSITGMICGTFDVLSQYIKLDELYNNPDFSTESDYFNMNAEAKIHLLPTLFRIIKSKKIHFTMHPVHSSK